MSGGGESEYNDECVDVLCVCAGVYEEKIRVYGAVCRYLYDAL